VAPTVHGNPAPTVGRTHLPALQTWPFAAQLRSQHNAWPFWATRHEAPFAH